MGRQDYETETGLIAHSLRAEGFDASEDGTGRGTPLVPVAFAQNSRDEVRAIGGNMPAARGRTGHEAADLHRFTAKDHGADASDISPTLRSGSHSGSHANGGVMPAVAFRLLQRQRGDVEARSHGAARLCRRSARGPNDSSNACCSMQGSAVRRLTPRECERLQGFPDDYTAVPYRGKPAADGPRYKALGNSMAVPVMRWIGERIALP
jgi:DNA (cytosine-5)-methyltransferase 1